MYAAVANTVVSTRRLTELFAARKLYLDVLGYGLVEFSHIRLPASSRASTGTRAPLIIEEGWMIVSCGRKQSVMIFRLMGGETGPVERATMKRWSCIRASNAILMAASNGARLWIG